MPRATMNLPEELFLDIFELLDKRDIMKCALVSRMWSSPAQYLIFGNIKISTHEAAVGFLSITQLSPVPSRQSVLQQAIRSIHIATGVVDTEAPSPVLLSELPLLLEHCTHVQSLKFDFASNVEDEFPADALEHLQQITTLRSVRNLDVKSYSFRASPAVQQFLQLFPAVVRLTLRGWMYQPEIMSPFYKPDPPPSFHLSKLVCDSVAPTFGHQLLKWVLGNTQASLQSLSINLNSPLLSDILQVHGPNLRSLTLLGSVLRGGREAFMNRLGGNLAGCQNLRSLHVDWSPPLSLLNRIPSPLQEFVLYTLDFTLLAGWVKSQRNEGGSLKVLRCKGVLDDEKFLPPFLLLEETCREYSVTIRAGNDY